MFWSVPHVFPNLRINETHLWLANLLQEKENIENFWDVLSDDERCRANRLLVEAQRANFIVARGILRKLLANYLFCLPKDIKFLPGEHGKLNIDPSTFTAKIEFNLSHSCDYALFAFANNKHLGVDIEFMRSNVNVEEIARRFFSCSEANLLALLSKNNQIEAFFNCWTRKEAFVKAIGKGLYYPLNKFDVGLNVEKRAIYPIDLNVVDESLKFKTWTLFSLNAIAGYASSVAIDGLVEKEAISSFLFFKDMFL